MFLTQFQIKEIIRFSLSVLLLSILCLIGLNSEIELILSFLLLIILLYIIQSNITKKLIFPSSLIIITISPILVITIPELYLFNYYSDNVWLSINSFRHTIQFLYLLLFLLLPTIIYNTEFNEKKLFFTIFISQFIFISFNIYLIFSLKNDRSILNLDILWPIILYDYTIISLSILLFSYSVQKDEKIFKIISFLSIVNIFIICLHGSKGAWIGLPICFAILVFLNKKYAKKIILYFILLTSLLISSTFLPNSQIVKRVHYFKIQTQEVMNNDQNNSIGVRVFLWKYVIHNFKENPLIGQGFQKNYYNLCELQNKKILNTCQIHVHNVYLQFLYAYGILGFIVSLLIFLTPIIFYYRNKSVNLSIASAGIVFCLYLSICSLTDYSFFYTPLTIVYFLVNAFLISLIYTQKKNSEQI